MKGVITIFTLPSEIEDLALMLNNLKRSSITLPKDLVDYKIEITMCLSDTMVDWKKTPIPKDYIVDRVNECTSKLLDWCEYSVYFEYGDEILGCDSQRRKSLNSNPDADFFVIVDCDVLVNDLILTHIALSYSELKKSGIDDFIITPEIIKLWDQSWDPIVNEKYMNWTYQQRLDCDIYNETLSFKGNVNIKRVPAFKFAGGWFTTITKSLWEKIGVPESFGHYGAYDTFIMHCCTIMAEKGLPVGQFKMTNSICGEYYKYRTNQTIRNYVSLYNLKDVHREESNKKYGEELILFSKRI